MLWTSQLRNLRTLVVLGRTTTATRVSCRTGFSSLARQRGGVFGVSRVNWEVSTSDFSSDEQKNYSQASAWPGLVAGLVGLAGYAGYTWQRKAGQDKPSVTATADASVPTAVVTVSQPEQQPEADDGVKIIPLSAVRQHNSVEKGVWVTYGRNVYDVTSYLEQHPGGDKILLAAGGAVDPFWSLYAVHKETFVQEILATFKIGKLSEAEYEALSATTKKSDAFKNDPDRPPVFQVNSETPFNAEPLPDLALDTFNTPNAMFFVRNHLPVPEIDVDSFDVEITSEGGGKAVKLSLSDLKTKFPQKTVSAAIMCAGNRRQEMSAYKDVHGLSWGTNAISNAAWTGVLLRDVLQQMEVPTEGDQLRHVQFEGQDRGPEGAVYGASIPLTTALDPANDVLLAWAMNGEDVPLDHGYPLRLVVPGHVGARQVKWLRGIRVSKDESPSFWQRRDYKMFSPSVDRDNADWDNTEAIQESPVQSAICSPRKGTAVEAEEGSVTVRGYAWSGGGRGVVRVDVSGDGGQTWVQAELEQADQDMRRMWAWTLWEATIELPEDKKGQMELVCKATDVSHNNQPNSVSGIWNFRGLLNNAWHRVNINVV